MKTHIYIILLLFSLFADTSCKATTSDNHTTDEQDTFSHFQEEQLWLKSATIVAQETDDCGAAAILNFIKLNARLANPLPNQKIGLIENPETAKTPFIFLVITDLDSKNHKTPNNAQNIAATFTPYPPMITVYPQPMTQLWRGILLLHEGAHASEFNAQPYDLNDPIIFAMREVAVHEFQNRLLEKLGGQEYTNWLNAEIARIQRERSAINVAADQVFVANISAYNPTLEKAFGKSLSPFEQETRQMNCHIHANFMEIDRRLGKDTPASISEKVELYLALRQRLQLR